MFSSGFEQKSPITYMVERDVQLKKDPRVEGALQGAKAALLAAPIGAAVQALRDKSPAMGALVSGLGAGLLVGLSAAAIQKYRNIRTEANMRYHLRNMVDREPGVAS